MLSTLDFDYWELISSYWTEPIAEIRESRAAMAGGEYGNGEEFWRERLRAATHVAAS